MNDVEVIGLMNDWGKLNNQMSKMSLDDLKMLINYECSTKRRASFIVRMHQRYAKLKNEVERDALLTGGLL